MSDVSIQNVIFNRFKVLNNYVTDLNQINYIVNSYDNALMKFTPTFEKKLFLMRIIQLLCKPNTNFRPCYSFLKIIKIDITNNYMLLIIYARHYYKQRRLRR